MRLYLGFLLLATKVSSIIQNCNLPNYLPGFMTIQCYKYVNIPTTWTDSNIFCEAEGASLVALNNIDESTWFGTIINADTWIGLNNVSGTNPNSRWQWTLGHPDPVTYFNWQVSDQSALPDPDGGDPNINPDPADVKCVSYQFATKKWSDRSCSPDITTNSTTIKAAVNGTNDPNLST